MRYFEVESGLRMPASNEESSLIEKIIENKKLGNDKLNIREQELARTLVSRGILERVFIDKNEFFTFNDVKDVYW